MGIAARGVHCRLETTRERFAELVARHEQTLAVFTTCRVEFELLGIRTIILLQPVFSESSCLFRFQCLVKFRREFGFCTNA